ncbi:MAG: aconitate hydratase [Oligoflexales bacterium]|nr:aconitate hydratase [Oligoflexales bacterium]
MKSKVDTHPDQVQKQYEALPKKLEAIRKQLARPLTLSEKILFSHLSSHDDLPNLKRGESFLLLKPDRVAMQDATAQMALLQFMQSTRLQVAVPSSVHCDHLIRAQHGASEDMKTAQTENQEVFSFLKSASQKYGIGFWGPGAGIIHQVVLENYAYPGGLMIGTDSHTPNAGGLGMVAVGVGGADAVDVMAGMSWELLNPKLYGVKLTGKLQAWTSPKDIILKVLEMLTVKGGTNKILEYFGPGASEISCTGKATITNMGAELGATTSVFGFDKKMANYLRHTQRAEIADLAEKYAEHLKGDPEVYREPEKYFDELIEIDLDKLEPYLVGPHSPDLARPVSKMGKEVKEKNYPRQISSCLIGSCTNSSYEDIYKAAAIAKEALRVGVKAKTPLMISPGSTQIFETIKRDGLLDTLEEFGAVVLANACGPCIGQWKRDDVKAGERNTIVTSFNRNFRGRNDSNSETLCFIGSPEMVVAYAASGDLAFNPLVDSLPIPASNAVKAGSGPVSHSIRLSAPRGPELPENGFVQDRTGYVEPPNDSTQLRVDIKKDSERLEALKPFEAWDGKDFLNHLLLVKVKGKCTTDHISPAGPWLRFRGHLNRISDNMLLGATNSYDASPGKGTNQLTQEKGLGLSAIARAYKAEGERWIIVADENYGEGSSREHAAMSPRYLGASAVIVKSFARIHETNLKKQGVLALTFVNPNDYEKIEESDRISIIGLSKMSPGKNLSVRLKKKNGSVIEFPLKHSYNAEQIAWFKAGSALNLIQ